MIIKNEPYQLHLLRKEILQFCIQPRLAPELIKHFGITRPQLDNHFRVLIRNRLMSRHPQYLGNMTAYKALAIHYDWKERDVDMESRSTSTDNYGKGGIYLLAQRPPRLEKHPLRKMPKNAVAGGTLSAYDF